MTRGRGSAGPTASPAQASVFPLGSRTSRVDSVSVHSNPRCSTKTVRRYVHAAERCSLPQGRELTHQTALRARHASSVTASVDGPAAPRNGRHRSHAE